MKFDFFGFDLINDRFSRYQICSFEVSLQCLTIFYSILSQYETIGKNKRTNSMGINLSEKLDGPEKGLWVVPRLQRNSERSGYMLLILTFQGRGSLVGQLTPRLSKKSIIIDSLWSDARRSVGGFCFFSATTIGCTSACVVASVVFLFLDFKSLLRERVKSFKKAMVDKNDLILYVQGNLQAVQVSLRCSSMSLIGCLDRPIKLRFTEKRINCHTMDLISNVFLSVFHFNIFYRNIRQFLILQGMTILNSFVVK